MEVRGARLGPKAKTENSRIHVTQVRAEERDRNWVGPVFTPKLEAYRWKRAERPRQWRRLTVKMLSVV